jgi:hypothetical protein
VPETKEKSYIDFNNNVIFLPGHCWKHILDRRGAEFEEYYPYIETAVKTPDLIADSKKYNNSKIYILESKAGRNFIAKYFVVIVDANNSIVSARFDTELKLFLNIRKP